MAYKSRFRPSEVLVGGAWRVLTEADAEPAETARLLPETAS
jgi:arginyl-tRNA--protein-N-Asp/Glu arginylyltransferase